MPVIRFTLMIRESKPFRRKNGRSAYAPESAKHAFYDSGGPDEWPKFPMKLMHPFLNEASERVYFDLTVDSS